MKAGLLLVITITVNLNKVVDSGVPISVNNTLTTFLGRPGVYGLGATLLPAIRRLHASRPLSFPIPRNCLLSFAR